MEYLIDKKNKVIFGFSPKAGCSHIKTLLYYASLGKSPEDVNSLKCGEIHKIFNDIKLSVIEPYITSTSEKINVIIVTRHPFERLVSGFRQKYIKSDKTTKNWPSEIKLNLSNFVKEIKKGNWKAVDPHHFKPQSTNYLDFSKFKNVKLKIFDINKIDYDYIFSAYRRKKSQAVINKTQGHERFTKDFSDYTGELGNGEELDVNEYWEYQIDVSTFYSDEIKKKVFEIFKQDYINFGYNL